MPRSPNLDGNALKVVVAAVERMAAPVTWHGVVEAVRRETGFTYTRQTLFKHDSVRSAYEARKEGEPARPGARRLSPRARAERDGKDRLKAENEDLRAKLSAYDERFILIAYNAYAENIDEAILYRPLPPIDRSG